MRPDPDLDDGGVVPDLPTIETMMARFAPADIGADVGALPPTERRALAKILEAARLMDPLYLLQVWARNPALESRLSQDSSPLGRARYAYFLLNKGPWSRLDDHAPFVPGVPAKPPGANFYPEDAARAEIDAWLGGLSEPDRRHATAFFTVIRRDNDRRLCAVPYRVEYGRLLEPAAHALREAAALTAQPSLARYLGSRARAFETDEFYDSDVAWMEVEASIEPTIGPYEVYETSCSTRKPASRRSSPSRKTMQRKSWAGWGPSFRTSRTISPWIRSIAIPSSERWRPSVW